MRHAFAGHDAVTVQEPGWTGIRKGLCWTRLRVKFESIVIVKLKLNRAGLPQSRSPEFGHLFALQMRSGSGVAWTRKL